MRVFILDLKTFSLETLVCLFSAFDKRVERAAREARNDPYVLIIGFGAGVFVKLFGRNGLGIDRFGRKIRSQILRGNVRFLRRILRKRDLYFQLGLVDGKFQTEFLAERIAPCVRRRFDKTRKLIEILAAASVR